MCVCLCVTGKVFWKNLEKCEEEELSHDPRSWGKKERKKKKLRGKNKERSKHKAWAAAYNSMFDVEILWTVFCLAIGGLKKSYKWLTAILWKSSLWSEFLDHDEENSLLTSVALHRG